MIYEHFLLLIIGLITMTGCSNYTYIDDMPVYQPWIGIYNAAQSGDLGVGDEIDESRSLFVLGVPQEEKKIGSGEINHHEQYLNRYISGKSELHMIVNIDDSDQATVRSIIYYHEGKALTFLPAN